MTARELLTDALAKADECSPRIGACARLHAARVMARFDEVEARRLLRRALQELDQIPFTAQDRIGIEHETYLLTGAIAPDLTRRRQAMGEHSRHSNEQNYLSILLRHGHSEAAVDFLLSYEHAELYPFAMVAAVMNAVADDAVKLGLLRRAMEVWLGGGVNPDSHLIPRHMRTHQFVTLFAWRRKMLPSDEALRVLQSVVSEIIHSEDFPIQAQFDPENRMTFTSGRQYYLFEILHVLKRLDPELANTLVPQYPELAAAVAIFPFGQESVSEAREAQRPAKKAGEVSRPGYILGWGSEKDKAFGMALIDGQHLRQFEGAFKQGQAFLDDDLQDNLAFKECWPSTQAFRQVLYLIGEAFGEAGLGYLKQIPDQDVRLFAQIEFAAALAGAPQYAGMRVTASRREREEWELTNG